MDELKYPINVEILRMIGDDVSGNAMLFTISYLREDENTHKLVLSDDLELEKDFKIEDIKIEYDGDISWHDCFKEYLKSDSDDEKMEEVF